MGKEKKKRRLNGDQQSEKNWFVHLWFLGATMERPQNQSNERNQYGMYRRLYVYLFNLPSFVAHHQRFTIADIISGGVCTHGINKTIDQ